MVLVVLPSSKHTKIAMTSASTRLYLYPLTKKMARKVKKDEGVDKQQCKHSMSTTIDTTSTKINSIGTNPSYTSP